MNNVLSVDGLGFSYGVETALENISFAVEAGSFCALLGPNGAGKSTLFGLLTRLFTNAQGRIVIGGHDLALAPAKALAVLGVVFQQTTLDRDLTINQNLRYFAALHGLSGKDARVRIDAALAKLGMRERANEKVRRLSGGHRRRAEIARSLVHSPELILLDEPSVGLDLATRTRLVDYVHDLCDQTSVAVLWATHLTDEVRPDDRLLILDHGQIRRDGVARDIQGDSNLNDAFLAITGAKS